MLEDVIHNSPIATKKNLSFIINISMLVLQEKDSKKKKHVAEQKTTVSTIPSLSRMNKPAVIFVNVSGAEQLGVVVSGMNAKKPKLLYCTPKSRPGFRFTVFAALRSFVFVLLPYSSVCFVFLSS